MNQDQFDAEFNPVELYKFLRTHSEGTYLGDGIVTPIHIFLQSVVGSNVRITGDYAIAVTSSGEQAFMLDGDMIGAIDQLHDAYEERGRDAYRVDGVLAEIFSPEFVAAQN